MHSWFHLDVILPVWIKFHNGNEPDFNAAVVEKLIGPRWRRIKELSSCESSSIPAYTRRPSRPWFDDLQTKSKKKNYI